MNKIKILFLIWLILLIFVALALGDNPLCDKCGKEMTRIPTEIGELYICKHCAKNPIIKVEIEDKARRRIDEKNMEKEK